MIRVAIIGLGHIGRTQMEALFQVEGIWLVSACDSDYRLASIVPSSISFYSDHNKLLSDGGFEAVVVATPNSTHTAIARDVLDAGYQVILEKPAARSLDEFDSLENHARATGQHIYYAFHAAAAFEVNWLAEHLAGHEQRYGPLTAFHCRFFDPYLDEQGLLVPHAYGLEDCWRDSGVNALSVLELLVPESNLEVEGIRRSGRQGQHREWFSATATYAFAVDGADRAGLGFIDTAWDQGMNFKCTTLCFAQTGWRLSANHTQQTVTSHGPQGQVYELVRFQGNRLVNHYLGVFSDYVYRIRNSAQMNAAAARRIHAQLFETMGYE